MHCHMKTHACIDNPAHHALHEFDQTKVEEAMISAEINAELVCLMRTPNFPPGMHGYNPKRHDLIEGVSECMISRQEA